MLAEEEKSSLFELLLLLAQSCSIQQRSEDRLAPSPEPPDSTYLRVAEFDWLDLAMVVAALHLEGVEKGEDHLLEALLPVDPVMV